MSRQTWLAFFAGIAVTIVLVVRPFPLSVATKALAQTAVDTAIATGYCSVTIGTPRPGSGGRCPANEVMTRIIQNIVYCSNIGVVCN